MARADATDGFEVLSVISLLGRCGLRLPAFATEVPFRSRHAVAEHMPALTADADGASRIVFDLVSCLVAASSIR